jgi:Tol biopolymer transport system component
MCAATAIAAYLFEAHSRPGGIAAGTTLRRLTADKGLTTDATISADGKFVAYASDRADVGNLDIWVQRVAGGGAVRLTDNPADDYDPSISPDGSQVAFRSDRDGGGIYLVPVLGGDARLLIPKGNHPRFSPDGQMLMYSIGVMQEDQDSGELFVQRLSGGAPTPIGPGCPVFPFSPVWSPDSRRIIFFAECKMEEYSGWVATMDGRLSRAPGLHEEPVIDQWLTNPPRLLLPFDREGVFDEGSIRTLPISEDGTKVTGPPERLTFGTGSERHASAGNGLVVVSAFTAEDHIWGIPIDAGGHSNGPPRQLTSGSTHENLNYLSRDGRKLLFTSWRPDLRLYLADLRTGKEQEIPSGDLTWLDGGVLNPDATRLVFHSWGLSMGHSFYEGPVAGGFPKKIAGGDLGVYDWSPDGGTLFGHSGPAVDEVDVNSLSKTTFLQDPEYGIWNAHFSPDGRWVTFNVTKRDNTSQVYAVPFRKGLVPRSEWIPISDSGWDDKPHFSANGKLIVFSSDRDGFRCIWARPLGPDMHPTGDAFAVYHSHERRRSLRKLDLVTIDLADGPDMVVFNQEERTGNIWLLEPAKKGTH